MKSSRSARFFSRATLFAICLLSAGDALSREWTDTSGSYRVHAEIVSVAGGKVVLHKTTGEKISVAVNRLSAGDQQYIADWLENAKEIRPLIGRLAPGDDKDRQAALEELIDLGDDAAPAVAKITELLSDKNGTIRFYAARALRDIGPPGAPAVNRLLEMVRTDDNALEASQALYSIGDAALPMFKKAIGDEHSWVREIAAKVIGRSDNQREFITPLLSHDDPKIRQAGLKAFLVTDSEPKERIKQFLAALDDASPIVRSTACQALFSMADVRDLRVAFQPLLKLAADDEQPIEVRRLAVQALGEIAPDDPRFAPVAIAYLKLKDNEFAARKILQNMGPSAVEPLAELLTDSDRKLQTFAADGLEGVIAPRSAAIPGLKQLLAGDDTELKYYAVRALRTFGPEALVLQDELVKLLDHESYGLRGEVLKVLAHAGLPDETFVPILTKALSDDNVKREAVIALTALGPRAKSTVPDLKKLSTGDSSLAKLARQAINRIESPIDFSFVGHKDDVTSLAFSPDGKQIYSVGDVTYSVKMFAVWDAATGKRLNAVSAGPHTISRVTYSNDGKRVAAKLLWKVSLVDPSHSGQGVQLFQQERVNDIALSPDGKQLASVGEDDVIRTFDATTGEPLRVIEESDNSNEWLSYFPDGKRLATCGEVIQIWDLASGTIQKKLEGNDDEYIYCFSISPDGKWIANGSSTGVVRVWNVAQGERTHALEAHTGEVTGVAFNADGTRLASVSVDGTLRIWDTTSGEPVTMLEDQDSELLSVSFGPNGKVAFGDDDGIIRIWTP